MRLFVALDIPHAIRETIAETCERLKPAAPDARWVRPESQHLTLKFIGEQPEEKLTGIQAALGKVKILPPHSPAIKLRVATIYFFPYRRFPTVLAASVFDDGPSEIGLLPVVNQIERHLETAGIKREKRGFRAHLTVARLDPRGDHDALEKALEPVMRAEFGSFATTEFHLYRSQLQRGGALYTRLATFPFVE